MSLHRGHVNEFHSAFGAFHVFCLGRLFVRFHVIFEIRFQQIRFAAYVANERDVVLVSLDVFQVSLFHDGFKFAFFALEQDGFG